MGVVLVLVMVLVLVLVLALFVVVLLLGKNMHHAITHSTSTWRHALRSGMRGIQSEESSSAIRKFSSTDFGNCRT